MKNQILLDKIVRILIFIVVAVAVGFVIHLLIDKLRKVDVDSYNKEKYEKQIDSLQSRISIRDRKILFIDSLKTVAELENKRLKNDSIKIVKHYEKIISGIVVLNSSQLYNQVTEYLATADSAWRGYINSFDSIPNKTHTH